MTDKDISPINHVSMDARILRMEQAQAKQRLLNLEMRQEESQSEFTEWAEQSAFNPLLMKKRFETLDKKAQMEETSFIAEQAEEEMGQPEKVAKQYASKNPELNARTLMLVKANIRDTDSHEVILRKVKNTYPDPSLSDDLLDYLIETEHRYEIKQKFLRAKAEHKEIYGREIQAGKNIAAQAREFSKQGLGSPTALRDLYRDITGNPREPHDLFEELTDRFTFSQMNDVIDFILHSLGCDLKAKGPSIARGELQRLLTEGKSLQAFLSLFRFFKKRMPLITRQFNLEDLTMPGRITYELLGKILMKLLKERYPTNDKILRLAYALGISEELAAQIIIFTQYRDAIRNVSPRLFKSERHRQDVLMSLIETLSDLEDDLEEEEDENQDTLE